jgi:hypothetical protein
VRRALALAAALAASSVVACGYSTRRLTSELGSARTISVLPFANTGFRRDLELRLTQAVVEELRARTSLALATADRADLLLQGTVTAGESVVIQDEDRNDPILKRLEGGVQVRVTDRRTGAVVKEFNVADVVEFAPGRRGQSLAGSATDEWARRVAQRVVQGLEASF